MKLQDMAYDPEVDEVSALAAEWIEIRYVTGTLIGISSLRPRGGVD